MLSDLRFAVRTLLIQRTFTAVAVLTLALGIGANAAIFTVVNAVLLRPLPYPAPDRLVTVWQDLRRQGGPADEWATPGNLADWRRATDLFAGLAAIRGWSPTVSGADDPEQLQGARVTADYFDVLGIAMLHGRGFRAGEDVPNGPDVAVVTHALWQRRFGADPRAIGRVVSFSGVPHVIVGVLPPGFVPAVIGGAEVFRPIQLDLASPSRGAVILRLIGRLREGVALENARSRADVVARRLEAAYPDTNRGARISIVPLSERLVGRLKTSLLVLLGTVGLVLLIACANVANLFMARGLARYREIAIRAALGASRARIVRQLITESAVLATAGGALGLLLAAWTVDLLVRLAPAGLPRFDEVSLDARVVAFAAAISAVTAIVFGLAPAWRIAQVRDAHALKEGQRATPGSGTVARRVLVVAEVALAVVLLLGAGLLVRSFQRLQRTDLGFDARDVLIARIVPSPVKYRTGEQLAAFYDALLERVPGIPGVQASAITSIVPFTGDNDVSFEIEGRPRPRGSSEEPVAWYRAVSHAYFDVMSVRATRGRVLMPSEPSPVLVVNETMARRYWPAGDAIGARIRTRADSPWFTIVGVIRDMRTRGPAEPAQAEMFVPYRHLPEAPAWILLRTRLPAAGRGPSTGGQPVDPMSLVGALRQAVRELDPDLPLANVQTMDDLVATPLAQPRFLTLLAALFGGLAVALAACGIYGVLACGVSERTREIGVRLALGAARHDVFMLIVAQGLQLAALGGAIGVLAALAVSRALRSLLFEVSPTDPATIGTTLFALGLVAALACWAPATRATRVDPVQALRSE